MLTLTPAELKTLAQAGRILTRISKAGGVIEQPTPAPMPPPLDVSDWSHSGPGVVISGGEISYSGGQAILTSPHRKIPSSRKVVLEADVLGGSVGDMSDWYCGGVTIVIDTFNANGTYAQSCGEVARHTPGLLRVEAALPEPGAFYTVRVVMAARSFEGRPLPARLKNLRLG